MENHSEMEHEVSSLPVWMEALMNQVKIEASTELHAQIAYSIRNMLNLFKDELNRTMKSVNEKAARSISIDDPVSEFIRPAEHKGNSTCQRCDILAAERDRALSELVTARTLVDRSENLASEMQQLSRETKKEYSAFKRHLQDHRECKEKLERADSDLIAFTAQLAAVQKNMEDQRSVEEELANCRRILTKTQQSLEETQMMADVRAKEILALRFQLSTMKRVQAKDRLLLTKVAECRKRNSKLFGFAKTKMRPTKWQKSDGDFGYTKLYRKALSTAFR